MRYQDKKTKEILQMEDIVYDDVFSGNDFLEFAERVQLGPHDTTV